jgi:TRAP-type C4-dicarboxylate transport system permease small subunit
MRLPWLEGPLSCFIHKNGEPDAGLRWALGMNRRSPGRGRKFVKRGTMKTVAKIEEFCVCSFLVLLIVLVFVAALFRSSGIDLSWSVDMAQMLFAWTTFLGADLALHKHRHIGVDLLVNLLPNIAQRVILFVLYLLMLVFLGVIIFYGTNLSIVNYQRFLYTLPISYSFVTAAGPVGSLLMFITVCSHLADFFRDGGFHGQLKK